MLKSSSGKRSLRTFQSEPREVLVGIPCRSVISVHPFQLETISSRETGETKSPQIIPSQGHTKRQSSTWHFLCGFERRIDGWKNCVKSPRNCVKSLKSTYLSQGSAKVSGPRSVALPMVEVPDLGATLLHLVRTGSEPRQANASMKRLSCVWSCFVRYPSQISQGKTRLTLHWKAVASTTK